MTAVSLPNALASLVASDPADCTQTRCFGKSVQQVVRSRTSASTDPILQHGQRGCSGGETVRGTMHQSLSAPHRGPRHFRCAVRQPPILFTSLQMPRRSFTRLPATVWMRPVSRRVAQALAITDGIPRGLSGACHRIHHGPTGRHPVPEMSRVCRTKGCGCGGSVDSVRRRGWSPADGPLQPVGNLFLCLDSGCLPCSCKTGVSSLVLG